MDKIARLYNATMKKIGISLKDVELFDLLFHNVDDIYTEGAYKLFWEKPQRYHATDFYWKMYPLKKMGLVKPTYYRNPWGNQTLTVFEYLLTPLGKTFKRNLYVKRLHSILLKES